MRHLQISEGIDMNQLVETLTFFIYNQYQLPAVCDLVSYPLDLDHNFLLIKKQGVKGGTHFCIAVKVGQKVNKEEEVSIEKLVGLSNKTICIDLSEELESRIQRMYLSVIPELHARYAENKEWIERPSITFVNENYRKIYSRQAEGIYYYRTTSELLAGKLLIQTLKQTAFLNAFGIPNGKNQRSVEQNEPSLSIGETLTIYNNAQLNEKDAAHIKYSMLSYKEAIWMNRKKQIAEQLIFDKGVEDSNKRVLREVKKMGLDKKQINKLEWKYGRLKRFKALVQQQRINKELMRQYKSLAIWDLTPETIVLQLKQFYRPWIMNTLKQLQTSFNSIANRRDSKALGQFRLKCSKAVEILNNSQLQCQAANRSELLLKMRGQIEQYIYAHERIIQNEYLSVFKYIPYKFKFMWRNEPKIYHKAAFFALVLLLAWMQRNVIIGITLISLGLIFLAINI